MMHALSATRAPNRSRGRASTTTSAVLRCRNWPGRVGRLRSGTAASGGRAAGCGDRGSITVETAVALPALVFVLVVALWGVSAAAVQVACVDAARAGARAAARGEPVAAVRAEVARAAPAGASVDVRQDPEITRVMVRVVVDPPGVGLFPPLTLRAQAVAATEPA